jgi:hypothetical protein
MEDARRCEENGILSEMDEPGVFGIKTKTKVVSQVGSSQAAGDEFMAYEENAENVHKWASIKRKKEGKRADEVMQRSPTEATHN